MARKTISRRSPRRVKARSRKTRSTTASSIIPQKKTAIEAIRKKTSVVERALQSLETASKEPMRMRKINKWQKGVEEKIDFLTKTLTEVNDVVKYNTDNIKEVKGVLDHNYNNIRTIADILKHLFEKDKKDKDTIYSTLSKKLTT